MRFAHFACQGEGKVETARRGMDQNQHTSKRQSSGKCLMVLIISLASVARGSVRQSIYMSLHSLGQSLFLADTNTRPISFFFGSVIFC